MTIILIWWPRSVTIIIIWWPRCVTITFICGPRSVTISQVGTSRRSRRRCKKSQPMWTCIRIWWNRSGQDQVSLSVTSFQGSADDLCTISWTVERQSGSKISHSFPFLWKLPHLPWLHRQHLLLWPALCWVLVDWRGRDQTTTIVTLSASFSGGGGNVWLLDDILPWGVRLCGRQHLCWVKV